MNAAVFDGFSYTALGHLHRPQNVGSDTIRHWVTPLPYCFLRITKSRCRSSTWTPDGAAEISARGRSQRWPQGVFDDRARWTSCSTLRTTPGWWRLVLVPRSPIPVSSSMRSHDLEATYPLTIEVHLQPSGGAPSHRRQATRAPPDRPSIHSKPFLRSGLSGEHRTDAVNESSDGSGYGGSNMRG